MPSARGIPPDFAGGMPIKESTLRWSLAAFPNNPTGAECMAVLLIATLRAVRADAEKFQFVVKVPKPGFLTDFVFKLVDRTRRLDGLDAATDRANQVVAVFSGTSNVKYAARSCRPSRRTIA